MLGDDPRPALTFSRDRADAASRPAETVMISCADNGVPETDAIRPANNECDKCLTINGHGQCQGENRV
jgi:hypothetical protein